MLSTTTQASFALLIALLAAPLAARADEDPLAGLDAGQRRVVQKFVASQASDGMSASADRVRVQDLDGDGQPELVVLWISSFGNSQATTLSVLAAGRPQGGKRRWHEAAKVEVEGTVTGLSVDARVITVDSLTLGPKDARCCPTLNRHRAWALRGGKLVAPPRP